MNTVLLTLSLLFYQGLETDSFSSISGDTYIEASCYNTYIETDSSGYYIGPVEIYHTLNSDGSTLVEYTINNVNYSYLIPKECKLNYILVL